ncbi:MAG TPA: MFS transporter, partial [Nitrososphaeraceae archaeon]|nr:MFS transporter [Nitrososphaeraceae archaeon]
MKLSIIFTKVVFTLLLARIQYTINWFNISSIFYFIALDFNLDINMLGLITTSFLIGVGLFQVPAGILVAKYGPKRLSMIGILLSSIIAIISGLSQDVIQITIARFLIGIGMAFFFGASVTLISNYLGKENEGLGVGLLNSGHAIGALLGIFGWVALTEITGWRISIVIGGIIGVSIVLIMKIGLLKEDNKRDLKIRFKELKDVLFNKSLILLGITLLGYQTGATLTLTFIVLYLIEELHIDPIYAGLFGSLSLIIGIIMSPLSGKIYDKIKNAKKLLFISAMISALSIMSISISSIYIIIIALITSGIFLSVGFVVVYARARQSKKIIQEYQTLSVGYVNGISLFGSFWIPIIFSFTVSQFSYTIAWLCAGIIIIILSIP